MAASQVTGFHWIQDTGTYLNPNGDGTPIGEPELQKIIAEINSTFLMADPTWGGRIHAEGFGAHTFTAAGSGSQAVVVRNTQAGTTNHAQFVAQADGAGVVALQQASTSFTPGGGLVASGARLLATGSGGLSIATTHATADLRLWTNGLERVTVLAGGSVGIGTNAPAQLLHLQSPNAVGLRLQSTVNGNCHVGWYGPMRNWLVENEVAGGTLRVYDITANAVRAFWDANGHFSPGAPGVHNLGATAFTWARAFLGDGTAASPALNFGGTDGIYRVSAGVLGFATGGAQRWRIDASGNLLATGVSTQSLGADGAALLNVWSSTLRGAIVRMGIAGDYPTFFQMLDDETLRLVVDGTQTVLFGSDVQPGVYATRSGGTPIGANRTGNDGTLISLRQDGTEEGSISVSGNTVSYNAFVGSHYTQLQDAQPEPPPGTLMVSTGGLIAREGGGPEKFPWVEESSSRGQRGVYGVWFAMLTDDPELHVWALQDRPIYQVAALGLYYMRVTDTGGDISNGDLLHASPLKGLAERQVESDGTTYIPTVLDSTIARARTGVAWSAISPNARGIKEALISITM